MHTGRDFVAPWQEPVRGSAGDPAILALPGIEQMRRLLAGGTAAPIARLTGLELVAVEEGSCTFVMPATDWLLGPKGLIHTGMLAFLADAPLATSIMTALPARVPITTAELSMTFLGEPPAAGGNITARGKLIYADEDNGLSEVFVTDQSGRLVAHGTSRCFIYPALDFPEGVAPSDPLPEAEYETPDPYLRPAPFEQGSAVTAMSGLEILQAAIAGDIPLPAIDHLTGIRPVEAGDGHVVFSMPASGWLMNPASTIYGGIIACLAKSAASGAVQTIAPPGTQFTALDVKVNYLRPGVVGGDDLEARGTVIRRGRRLAIAHAEVLQDGKQVAVATGSTALRDS